MSSESKRVVTIGGGGGQSAVVRALKHLPIELTALTNVVDDGGGSGKMMQEYQTHHTGEPLRVLMAFGDERAEQLTYRFVGGRLDGQTIGNVLLGGHELALGSQQAAIDRLAAMIGVQHRVIPIADESLVLHSKTVGGVEVKGQRNTVLQIRGNTDDPIISIAIEPADARLSDDARDALTQTEVIIVTMGDLFSSVAPSFCIPELDDIFARTSAQVIWMPNPVMTPGHVQYEKISGALAFLQQCSPHFAPDTIIAHDGSASPEIQEALRRIGYALNVVDIDPTDTTSVITSDLVGNESAPETSTSDVVDRSPVRYSTQRLKDIFSQEIL